MLGFVASIQRKVISGKYMYMYVVVAKVCHSQRMNDPLVNVCIIAATDGTILSAHCLGILFTCCQRHVLYRMLDTCQREVCVALTNLCE